ncbi:hypothetical protein R2601_03348 [Salipiger bermudensis HTCC2601]|uniref:Uncharacterized protein n=1 Tax=Salipiger bermudensis (strain DSM 26914 / JCM 13377 / KCTC 12554 / HTCC2601) TaxID=314265 RepID=Q0FWH6_SALBH|nr:hypothetical protein R2601_03348 [Salipiger bermudensis HTCC2601]
MRRARPIPPSPPRCTISATS